MVTLRVGTSHHLKMFEAYAKKEMSLVDSSKETDSSVERCDSDEWQIKIEEVRSKGICLRQTREM